MKKGIVLLAVMVASLLIVGCNEELCRPTAWLLGGSNVDAQDNAITGRLGIRNPEGIEFGAETNYLGIHGLNQSYGAYVIAEGDPTPVGTPYLGYHATLAVSDLEDAGQYGPILGTIIKVGNIETVIEGQYLDYTGNMADFHPDDNDKYKFSAGVRVRF